MFHAGHASFYVPLALPCYSSVCRFLHHLTETSHSGPQTGRRRRREEKAVEMDEVKWGWGRLWGWRRDEENNKSRQKQRHKWRGEVGREDEQRRFIDEGRNKREEIRRGRKIHSSQYPLKTIMFKCSKRILPCLIQNCIVVSSTMHTTNYCIYLI